MPRYTYRCEECKELFEKIHSIKERLTDCELCNSPNSLNKIPSSVNISTDTSSQHQKGSEVREFIEENRSVLKDTSQHLQGRKYKDK